MPSFRILIAGIALTATLALSLPLVAGFFGRLHPAFDSFAHFRVHLAVAMGLSALPLLLSPFWKHGLLAIVLAAGSVATAVGLPLIGPVQASFQPKDGRQPAYRALHLNTRFNHPEPHRVLSLIEDVSPDIVLLNEVSDMWVEQIATLAKTYPHHLICGGRRWAGGVAILSRRPFVEAGRRDCLADGNLGIASVDFDGQAVDVAAVHLYWPWPYGQPDQVAEIAPVLRTLGDSTLLAGDLNATPWSDAARRLAGRGGLTPMRSVGPTWLTWRLPKQLRPFIGLPIDHVLTKRGIVLHSGRALGEVGSDHLPVLIEFSIVGGGNLPDGTAAATASLLPFGRLPKV